MNVHVEDALDIGKVVDVIERRPRVIGPDGGPASPEILAEVAALERRPEVARILSRLRLPVAEVREGKVFWNDYIFAAYAPRERWPVTVIADPAAAQSAAAPRDVRLHRSYWKGPDHIARPAPVKGTFRGFFAPRRPRRAGPGSLRDSGGGAWNNPAGPRKFGRIERSGALRQSGQRCQDR